MGNPIDAMGCCIVCGKRCESTGGCDCSEVESCNHVPLKRAWKRTLVDADELAALRARVAELLELLREVRPELNQYNVSLGTLTRIDAALQEGGRQ